MAVQQPPEDLPSLMDPNAGQLQQAPDAMDENSIRDKWTKFFSSPEGEVAKLQFAASLLQNAAGGGSTLGNFSTALGDAVGAFGRAKVIGAEEKEKKAKEAAKARKGAISAAKSVESKAAKDAEKKKGNLQKRADYYTGLMMDETAIGLDETVDPSEALAWGRFMAEAEDKNIAPDSAARIWQLAKEAGKNPYSVLDAEGE